jgi:hypothetical protein
VTLRHKLADRGNDVYQTPGVAVQALQKVEQLPHHIWEPACGYGAIVRVLRDAGHTVTATDLVDYACPDSSYRIDFLMERHAPPGVEAVVTNPPYKLAAAFVAHALELVPYVAMLLRLPFIEAAGKRDPKRAEVLDGGKLARVHVFRNRLPMMHREGWAGPRSTSQVAFAWFVFERDHQGPTILNRITWEPAVPP